MVDKIEFEDKVSVRNSGFDRKNSVVSADLNEIKTKFNSLVDALDTEFVKSVSGDNVDNDDPTNPVIETAEVENIMSANLTADADRSQDMNSKVMSFTNGKQFKWLNNVAPTIGEGSFDFQGYGTTASDIVYRVKRGDGNGVMTIYGDRVLFPNLVETATGFKGGALTLGNSNFILSGSSGTVEMQAYNGNTIKINPIANDVWLTPYFKFLGAGGASFIGLPSSNTGLSTGGLYVATAATILANGDNQIGVKA